MQPAPPPGRPGRPGTSPVAWRRARVEHEAKDLRLVEVVSALADPRSTEQAQCSRSRTAGGQPGQHAEGRQFSGVSASLIMECLDVAIMKLSIEPGWKTASSKFFDHTLGTMCRSAQELIEENRAARLKLMRDSEFLQERLLYHESCLAHLHRGRMEQEYRFRQQAEKLSLEFQEAEQMKTLEKQRLEVARERYQELEATRKERLSGELEETDRQRKEILGRRDQLLKKRDDLAFQYQEMKQSVDSLTEEAAKLRVDCKVCQVDADLLPGSEQVMKEKREQRQTLALQLKDLQEKAAGGGRSSSTAS